MSRGAEYNARGIAYRRKMEERAFKRKKDIIISTEGYDPARGYFPYKKINGNYIRDYSYIKYADMSHGKRALKRWNNHYVRHASNVIMHGSGYKKEKESWWIYANSINADWRDILARDDAIGRVHFSLVLLISYFFLGD